MAEDLSSSDKIPASRDPLGRSSIEAYAGIAIAILAAVLSMTWWLKLLLMLVLAGIAGHLAFRSPWTVALSRVSRSVICLVAIVIVAVISWNPIMNQYIEDIKRNEVIRPQAPGASSNSASPNIPHAPQALPIPLPTPPRYRFAFGGSPDWPEPTRARVSTDLNRFCSYLSDIGFDVPARFPQLQLIKGGVMEDGVGIRQFMVIPPFWPTTVDFLDSLSLMIAKESASDLSISREALAQYLFSIYTGANDVVRTDWEKRREAAPIIAAYFTWSYSGRATKLHHPSPPDSLKNWTSALWDLHRSLGKNHMDKVLYYAVKNLGRFEWPGTENFDAWFFNYGIIDGETKQGFQHVTEMAKILHNHGINVWTYRNDNK